MADKRDPGQRDAGSQTERPRSTSDADAEISVEDAAISAQRHIRAVTGRQEASVTSVEPTGEGWDVEVELVEEERIPPSQDVLGLYEVELDLDGHLVAYRRTRRYSRTSSLDGSNNGKK